MMTHNTANRRVRATFTTSRTNEQTRSGARRRNWLVALGSERVRTMMDAPVSTN